MSSGETSEYGHLQDSREIQREPSKGETFAPFCCPGDGVPEVYPYDHEDGRGTPFFRRRLWRLGTSFVSGREAQARYRVGRVSLEILCASQLRAADFGGTSDPSCAGPHS